MVLNLEQLRAVTVGAARVEQQDSGFRFFRFTQAQEEAYQLRSADFYMKTFATANVRLEFETDSRELSLSVTAVPGSSRRFFAHDIYVGDRLIGQLGGKLEKDEEGKPIPCTVSNRFSLGNGTKTVRIYFPWSACSTLHALSLDDGSTLRPVPKKRTMLIFGDSITHGYDADHPSLSYANRLADALCANARNKGIGGEIFWPELAMRSDEDISPDLITVAYGTNDWSARTKEEFERDCRLFYETLSARYPSAHIFALAPIWRVDWDRETKVGRLADVKRHLLQVTASLPNVTVIDCFDFLPHEKSAFRDLFVHPNDAGFGFYIDQLIDPIQTKL